ncbi:MAG: hypothetical protein KY391_01585 [Actinobacteria bacterium]|nr:hypothetical protein [Actinomycetota bacterium]
MVETISPVVYGRRSNYVVAIALHAVAATATAAATGAVLGVVGLALGGPWGNAGAVAVIVVALAYALREAFGVPVPLPQARRQVPEWWRTFFSPPIAATLYGAGLGVAFLTFLSYGTFVAVAIGAVVSADPILGATICAPFGLARGMAVAVVGWRSVEPGAAVTSLATAGATAGPRLVNAGALGAIALVASTQILY